MLYDDNKDFSLERMSLQKRSANDPMQVFPALAYPKDKMRPVEHAWSPYTDNGGTAVAIAGSDFAIVGGDTRLNGNFNFLARDDTSKTYQLTEKTILCSTGMQADRLQLQQVLKHRIRWYKHNNGGRTPSTAALAQMLSSILYGRRFFPYYTFNVLAGLDENGKGVCYSYDAVGCTEPLHYGTTGSGEPFVEPLMDCLINRINQSQHGVGAAPRVLTQDEAMKMIRNAFTSAAERDVNTGDGALFYIITKDGVKKEFLELRHD